MDKGEFPKFSSGDVLIISQFGTSWRLHSFCLKAASTVFADILSEAPIAKLTKSQKAAGGNITWKIKMEMNFTDTRFSTFTAMNPNMKEPLSLPPNINGIGLGGPDCITTYDNLFRCMYNMDPDFQDQNDLRNLIASVVTLLQAAEELQATQVVRREIEAQLLRAGPSLWHHVSSQPEPWADLGARLRSPTIFREAICHLVGAWNLPDAIRKDTIDELEFGKEIIKLCLQKVGEIDSLKKEVEAQLLEFFPATMMHSRNEKGIDPGRTNYAGDIYQWQAIVLIRQYISNAMLHNLHHRADDGGAALYRQIAAGNTAYLTRHTLDPFFSVFQMTKKGQECLEGTLHFMKEQMRPLVSPLLIDRTQTAGSNQSPRFLYLTCAEVSDSELPWVARQTNHDQQQRVALEEYVEHPQSMLRSERPPLARQSPAMYSDNYEACGYPRGPRPAE